jgi:hypothetical protein
MSKEELSLLTHKVNGYNALGGGYSPKKIKCKMAALSKEEILAGLKKLGINSTSELKSCLKEYKEYYQKRDTVPLQKHQEVMEDSYSNYGTFANRFSQVCHSIVSIIIHSLTLSKVKAVKRIDR